jgi:CrcB protein
MWQLCCWVGLGGALGSIIRYLLANQFNKINEIPCGTLLVNVVGCLLMGLIMGFISKSQFDNQQAKLLLATGFCGGFTTFSAFSFENIQLLQEGKVTSAFIYIAASLILCFSATWLGLKLQS